MLILQKNFLLQNKGYQKNTNVYTEIKFIDNMHHKMLLKRYESFFNINYYGDFFLFH